MDVCDFIALALLACVYCAAGMTAWIRRDSEPDPNEVGSLCGQTVQFRTREVTLPW